MPKSDWSQFIPNLIVAFIGALLTLIVSRLNLLFALAVVLVTLIVSGVIAYLKLDRFKQWFNRLLNKIMLALKWLITKWRLIVLYSFVVVLGMVIFRIYPDWRIVAFSLVCYAVGLLSWRISKHRPIVSTETKTKFLPISLFPGVGNSYFKSYYIAPPSGNVFLGNAQFRLEPDSLIFDTNGQIHYFLPRSGGGKEIDLRLPQPQNQVKSVYFLINSGNSRSIYAHKDIGEIRLVFKDAPPIVVDLILGENIREWCPGNPGDYVREASSPMVTMGVWTGLSKGGGIAVIDCLQIPVYECMRNCYLERIIFVLNSPLQPPDTMGVHFLVFAISLEIEQRIQH